MKLEGTIEPGSALKAAIKKLVNDDGVSLTFKGKFEALLSQSPRGTLEVSKTRVGLGDSVDLVVRLDPETLEYAVVGYNVAGVELWRKKEGDIEFSHWKFMDQVASNQFQYRWEPTGDDVGKSRSSQPSLPRNCQSCRTWRSPPIPCGQLRSGASRRARSRPPRLVPAPRPHDGPTTTAVAAASTCADRWVGQTSHVIDGAFRTDTTVTWELGEPTEHPAVVLYHATGTLNFFYTVFEDMGYSVTPKVFPITPIRNEAGQVITPSLVVDYRVSPAVFSSEVQSNPK